MQSPSPGLLLLLFFLMIACPGSAQEPEANLKIPPPPTAAEHDAKAWRELSSPAGGFAVLLPGRPEDEKRGSVDTGVGVMNFHLFPLITEVAIYIVSYTEMPFTVTTSDAAEKLLDRAVGQVVGVDQNKLLSESRISLGGSPGRRFEVEVPHLDCVVNGKTYIVNNRLYTLVITTRRYQAAPKETAGFYESVIGKFLDSFRFAKGDPRPSGARRAVGHPRKKNRKP